MKNEKYLSIVSISLIPAKYQVVNFVLITGKSIPGINQYQTIRKKFHALEDNNLS